MRRTLIFCGALVFLGGLSGCATLDKQKDLEMQGLRMKTSVLETQIENRDQEISSLREALSKLEEEKTAKSSPLTGKKVIGEVKFRPKARAVQLALKNAGYDPGRIDGRMGRQTREAIKAFQRANNLKVDGRVGRETWALLKEYLYKKVK